MSAPRGRKLVIGLVGGIGSGKSLVARQFGRLGCGVIDADDLARRALDEPAIREQLARWWGPTVLGPDGRVDRAAVGRIVFDRPDELRRLEDLVHPRVYEAAKALRRQYDGDPAVKAMVFDVPLLLEKGLDRDCDAIVFVDGSRSNRLARVQRDRGWDEAELARREKNQWPLDRKAARADHVVDNNAGEMECLAHVRRILARLLEAAPNAARNPPDQQHGTRP